MTDILNLTDTQMKFLKRILNIGVTKIIPTLESKFPYILDLTIKKSDASLYNTGECWPNRDPADIDKWLDNIIQKGNYRKVDTSMLNSIALYYVRYKKQT